MADMQILVKHYANGAPGAPRSIAEAEEAFNEAVSHWFAEFGLKTIDRHCLVMSPPRMYWSREITKYTRTADLVLEGKPERVLVHKAVEYVSEWTNPKCESSNPSKT